MNSLATQLCPCGSGLRTVRCCGLNPAALPPADSTRHLVPLVERAVQAHRQGAIETAERLCLDVLEMAPDRPGALSVLYQIRRAQGNATAAEALLRRVVSFDPNNFVATNELALMLMGKGNLGEAEVHARNAIRIAPQNAQAHNLMGMIMTEAQRPRIGEYHYRQVLELSGQRDPILLANLAWNLKNQGRMEEARVLYEESIDAAPEIKQTLLGWARLEEADRQFAAAGEKLDKMDVLWPNDAGVMMSRAVLLGREKRNDEALAVLDAVAAQNPDGKLGPNELLEKGRLLDQMGRYDEAFADFTEGKRLARELSGHQYLDQHAEELTNRLRGFFRAAADSAARRRAHRRAAAGVRAGLSTIGHHAGRADTDRPSQNRCWRRTAAHQRHYRHHAPHAQQPARLSRGDGRTVDGRSALGAG
jgi:tetratricopeptide (TPR) repeat protein